MRATVLSDNISSDGLKGEWGLSIYIEYGDRRILLDAGASDLFLKNAEKLGMSIAQVDSAVLSHAHYDHADGMEAFFRANSAAPFYLRQGAAEDCRSKEGFFYRYIGLPKGILQRYPGRIVFVDGKFKLSEGVWLLPHTTPGLDKIGQACRMYRGRGRKRVPDDFAHEQSLVFETSGGLVVFNSCCHGGADNIVREASEAFPGVGIRAIIGGFHLFGTPEEKVRDFAARLRETGVGEICTGHCTGQKACRILSQELGDAVRQLHVGMVMEY